MNDTHAAAKTPVEIKREGIMAAMNELVMRYGFSRVTMDEIAKACGLSRPALYQFFKNKQEIYRAIASRMCTDNLAVMDDVMGRNLPLKEKIIALVFEGKLVMLSEMEATQHGAELLDLGNDLSADIIGEYTLGLTTRLAKLYDDAIGPRSGFSGQQMASDLIFWLDGMKPQLKPLEERTNALERFVGMQFAAIGAD